MKKIFTSLLLLLGLVQGIRAQEPYAVLSNDNTTLTFYYDNNKEAMGGMGIKPFSSQERPEWYTQHKTITTVVFDNSFAECTSLTSTAYWFTTCTQLTTFEKIGNLKTDNVIDMTRMFSGCSMTSLDLSYFKTDNVTGMSWMFSGCSNLASLDLSHFKTDNVTDMSRMFSGCSSLASVDLSHFKTDNVTSMSGMFSYCSKLTSLDVSHFKTDKVTDMIHMFWNCSSLTSLDVSHFKTDNVTGIEGMFNGCSSLTSLDVSHFKMDNVTDMSRMFNRCSALNAIYCNSAWTGTNLSSESMFDGCTSLKGAISYDSENTDATYANPDTGYFTRTGGQVVIEGDVNGDGKVNVTDIVTEVNENGGKDNKNIDVIVNKIMQTAE